jgi:hypothetical protein
VLHKRKIKNTKEEKVKEGKPPRTCEDRLSDLRMNVFVSIGLE